MLVFFFSKNLWREPFYNNEMHRDVDCRLASQILQRDFEEKAEEKIKHIRRILSSPRSKNGIL